MRYSKLHLVSLQKKASACPSVTEPSRSSTGAVQSEPKPPNCRCSPIRDGCLQTQASTDGQVATFKEENHATIFVSIPNSHHECPQRTHSAVYGALTPPDTKQTVSELEVGGGCCHPNVWRLLLEPTSSTLSARVRCNAERARDRKPERPHIHTP